MNALSVHPPAVLAGLRARARAARRQIAAAWRLRAGRGLRLHLGCGGKQLPGFINIDMNRSPATDYVGDLARLPCRPGSVERIESYHVIEHIPRPQVRKVLAGWRRLLAPGGVLVLECPDFEADLREVLDGDAERMYSIFGRQRFPGDAHHWGYTATSLARELEAIGYVNARASAATDYHAGSEPCIRVEAEAPPPRPGAP
jgi:hypothetical protein